MSNLRRKLRALSEPNVPAEEPREQPAGEGSLARSPIERLGEYSIREDEHPAPRGSTEAATASVVDEGSESREVETPGDLGAVGEEVGTILKSAQDAAEQIRQKAQNEAERLRTEARSAAAAEVAQARRLAEADRAAASRLRAEAEAYAKDARAAADSFAEQRRRDAEHKTAQMLVDARERLAAADAEVEQRVRQAEAHARERRELLEAEVERYEERIENFLVVFRGMGSQLEDVLGRHRSETRAESSEEPMEEALRPDRSEARVG
jgi:cell division septum initiation protein DivIVA